MSVKLRGVGIGDGEIWRPGSWDREMSSVPPTAHSPIIRDGDGGLKGDKGHLFMRSTRHWRQLATSGDGLWQ